MLSRNISDHERIYSPDRVAVVAMALKRLLMLALMLYESLRLGLSIASISLSEPVKLVLYIRLEWFIE